MTTSPHTPSAASFPLPSSPTNHTPKANSLKQISPSVSPNQGFRAASSDPENPPPGPPANTEVPWTAAHPCYPHPNPHVSFNDRRRETTRVIRVPRDWSEAGDLYPQFSDTYPEILTPWVSEREFRSLINNLNAACRQTFYPVTFRSWIDSCLGFLTGWLWDDFGLVAGKSGVRQCEAIISSWNEECQRRRRSERERSSGQKDEAEDGVAMCVALQRTAWTSLDFVIPDPKVTLVAEDRATAAAPRTLSRNLTPKASGERVRSRKTSVPGQRPSADQERSPISATQPIVDTAAKEAERPRPSGEQSDIGTAV